MDSASALRCFSGTDAQASGQLLPAEPAHLPRTETCGKVWAGVPRPVRRLRLWGQRGTARLREPRGQSPAWLTRQLCRSWGQA